MQTLIGVDLGTSSVKVAALNVETKKMTIAGESYEIDIPKKSYAEQDPELWWQATVNSLKKVVEQIGDSKDSVKGISFSGQMHGLVMIDKNLEIIRPSIIWCDQRTKKQVETINRIIGVEKLTNITLNPMNTGFLIASLLWIKENEKESYDKIYKVMLPKDYLRFKMTGEIATDYSDASGSMVFDVPNRKWSKTILEKLGISLDLFPKVSHSFDIAGYLTDEAAETLGLSPGIAVAYGGGDQQMQALGNGLIKSGTVSATIGTGGQLFMPIDKAVHDENNRIHTFCNSRENTWCLLGASLCAGLSLKWLNDNILTDMDFDQFNIEAEKLAAGSDGLVFLPYLIGERTPHMDPDAKGMFFGLTLKHNRANMIRAVMEGVAFSLKESLDIMEENGVEVNKIIASGGGAKSKLWKQIQADIYNQAIYTVNASEQACLGAIITAGVGTGIYEDLETAVDELVTISDKVTYPIAENVEIYKKVYEVYKQLYVNNKELFKKI